MLKNSFAVSGYPNRCSSKKFGEIVLAMGGRVIGSEVAGQIVRTWITTDFAGGRHERRVNKIMALEK